MARLSILFVASECAPFAKAGGLGDVVGALPIALQKLGHDVRVVLPKYDLIKAPVEKHAAPLGVPLGADGVWAGIFETRLPHSEVPIYFLENHDLFSRGYLYDPPNGSDQDNLARYTFLSRGALQLCKALNWYPDVIHVHDWPSALIPAYLNTVEAGTRIGQAATVLTIHNIAHPGKFPREHYGVTQLPWSLFREDGFEDYNAVNTLKGGLYHATKLTAVSPTYAQEIRTSSGGFGLDQVLRFRGADVVGILNGIDEHVWNPATDPHLPAHFDVQHMDGKAHCKRALQQELGLAQNPNAPLIGVVSRLGDQKGTDIIASALPRILAMGAQVVVLGSGDGRAEEYFRRVSSSGTDMFRAWIGFHEPLSHRIEAASDLFLMPSRFEPCGLNQLYSQRYGTLPIVRATGGLADTVTPYDPRNGSGTGFSFSHMSEDALVEVVRWAIDTYHRRRDHFVSMQQQAMSKRMGWDVSAMGYLDVYRWAMEARRGA